MSTFGVRGVAVNIDRNLFITDNFNHVIWFFNTTTLNLSIIAGSVGMPGLRDGQGSAARFNKPDLVRIDASGRNAIVAEPLNCVIRLVTPTGVVTSIGSTACGAT